MLKIRFILLFGVLLGSVLSFAVVKGRPRSMPREEKKMTVIEAIKESRKPSQQ